jgi:hypothetical protein
MRLIDFICSTPELRHGNQTGRARGAVIFPATITIIKDAGWDDAQDFSFTISVGARQVSA